MAFIDEVFKANSAILNTLLTVLNERLFDNGAVRETVPLLCLVRLMPFAVAAITAPTWMRSFHRLLCLVGNTATSGRQAPVQHPTLHAASSKNPPCLP